MRPTLSSLLPCLLLSALLSAPALAAEAPHLTGFGRRPPRLVVFLIIDQFRADYLSRFGDRLGPDGLRPILEGGAWFPFAEYDVMQAMTGPDHATIATGAWPAHHGLPLNNWADRSSGERVYCVEDPDTQWVGAPTPRHAGTSPRNLRAPTLGDALKDAGGASKVVTIALKDRVAITTGGRRADEALWLDKKALIWVSSRFYRPDGTLPAWVRAQNTALRAQRGRRYTWSVKGPGNGLSEEGPKGDFERSWILGEDPGALESPLGFDLVVDLGLEAVRAEHLGADRASDILVLGFSAFDLAGHHNGPDHRIMEELVGVADRSIARLRARLEREIPGGLGEVLFVLTGDHGVAPRPELAAAHRHRAGRFDMDQVKVDLERHLTEHFGPGPGAGWVRAVEEVNVYLAPKTPNGPALRAAAARWLRGRPGVRYAVTSDDVVEGRLPPEPMGRRILNQYVPQRSGDVVVILEPYFIYAKDPAAHLTGYTYDRLVPLAFAGPGIRPGVYPAGAQIIDVAPTVAFLLGILPPALAQGRVLSEALAPTP